MPGSKDRNLRSGYIHEDLGALLLRPAALVAPVPTPEDVGIDAVATLLRPHGGRQLIPEDTFAVQFKASSVRVVDFEGADAVRWLLGLELPFFIGSIRVEQAAIDLYPTHGLFKLRAHASVKEVHLHLDGCNEVLGSPEVATVCIGPPVHSWPIDRIADTDFPASLYPILKGHIQAAQRNVLRRPIGHFEPLTWQPGQPPQQTGAVMIQHGGDGQERTMALASLVAPLQALLATLRRQEAAHLPAVFRFIQTLRGLGVDPDPGDGFLKMAMTGPPDEERRRVLGELLRLGISPCRYSWNGQTVEPLS